MAILTCCLLLSPSGQSAYRLPKEEPGFFYAGTVNTFGNGLEQEQAGPPPLSPTAELKDIGNANQGRRCSSELQPGPGVGAAVAFVVNHSLHFSRFPEPTEQTLSWQRQLHLTLVYDFLFMPFLHLS